eukprot:c16694_g1_i1.p1 GENE.c16694_g1_i1~~c16694_g1_i1.p1  ORF type:complete len:727 (-),score=259.06 c16694_g1_i1:15-2195(-)
MELTFEVPKSELFVRDFIDDIHTAVAKKAPQDPEEMTALYQAVLKSCCKKYKITLGKSEIYNTYQKWVNEEKIPPSMIIESLSKTRSVRSWSGVLPISVATDGNTFSCAYDCHFCPNECRARGAKRDISRSYLSSEGTFIRGAIEDFEGHRQVWRRLLELELMGHPPDKCEMIILGGTWDCYDVQYRVKFITELFYACNVYHRISIRMKGDLSDLTRKWIEANPFSKHLAFDFDGAIRAQLRPMGDIQFEKNENTLSPCARIIGIVLETRPDQIKVLSLMRKRKLGCTRIQLGIQHVDDSILELNNRGHGVQASINAIQYARDACFKVDGHIMPDLPGTTFEKDIDMIDRVFRGTDLQLDYCKIYPCLDLPFTVTREWKHSGKWKPMAEFEYQKFLDIISYAVKAVPPWTRINRVQRDFPEAQEKNDYLGFVSDNIKTNLHDVVLHHLSKKGEWPRDIRTREVKNQIPTGVAEKARVFVRAYRASAGTELFISVEIPTEKKPNNHSSQNGHPDHSTLLGLLRLRFPDAEIKGEFPRPKHYLPDFSSRRSCSRIRELHVYGNLVEVSSERKATQHSGVGKFLMNYAELLSAAYGFDEIAVISGVGVRQYYTALGYKMKGEGEFLFKSLKSPHLMNSISLFGKNYSQATLVIPVSKMTVPKKYLEPVTIGFRIFPVFKKWWKFHTYDDIQNGEPQLAVIERRQSSHIFFIVAFAFVGSLSLWTLLKKK